MEKASLDRSLAENVARLRGERGWRQADLAHRMTRVGVPWNRVKVAHFENAQHPRVDPSELVALCAVLCTSVSVLLRPTGELVTVGDAKWPTQDVEAAIEGRDVLLGRIDSPAINEARERAVAAGTPAWIRWTQRWGLLNRTVGEIESLMSESKGQAAQAASRYLRRRGLRQADALDVVAAADALWHHSLLDERERRVTERAQPQHGERALQALRGHVTRDLHNALYDECSRALTTEQDQQGEEI
jgi:hypothetical protein